MFKQFAATQILANAIASVLDLGKDLSCENVVSTMMVEASKNEIPDAEYTNHPNCRKPRRNCASG